MNQTYNVIISSSAIVNNARFVNKMDTKRFMYFIKYTQTYISASEGC
jgi:hypothetical protein